MSARQVAVALALMLAAQPVLAESARSRGGSSRGDRSASAGARHHSSSSGSATSSSRGSSSTSSPGLTDAERRHPRAGTGHGYRTARVILFHGYPYYYRPYGYYDPFYSGFYGFYGYSGAYYPPYYGGYPYGSRYRESGAIRVLVDPEQTRVYVDGYYAGIADDFDGIFQRLYVSPGRHEITLKLEGYRTHRMRIYVPYDHTVKIHHDMVKGSGEDAENLAGEEDRYEDSRYGSDEPPRTARREQRRQGPGDEAEPGTLKLDVQPSDASLYVDGEFRGLAREARSLELSPGRHRVEIVRPGYRTWERELEIRPGASEDVEVELER